MYHAIYLERGIMHESTQHSETISVLHSRWKSLIKLTLLPQIVSFLRLFDGATRTLIVVALLLSTVSITAVAVGGFSIDLPDESVVVETDASSTQLS